MGPQSGEEWVVFFLKKKFIIFIFLNWWLFLKKYFVCGESPKVGDLEYAQWWWELGALMDEQWLANSLVGKKFEKGTQKGIVGMKRSGNPKAHAAHNWGSLLSYEIGRSNILTFTTCIFLFFSLSPPPLLFFLRLIIYEYDATIIIHMIIITTYFQRVFFIYYII